MKKQIRVTVFYDLDVDLPENINRNDLIEGIRDLIPERNFNVSIDAGETDIYCSIKTTVDIETEVLELRRYLELIDQDQFDCPEAIEIRNRLDAIYGNDHAELTKADVDIRMRKFQSGL